MSEASTVEATSSVEADASLHPVAEAGAPTAAESQPQAVAVAPTPPGPRTRAPLPPGYVLVTVRLTDQATPLISNLPVEVLPRHTFADLCAAALARSPDAPRDDHIQAFLLLDQLEVPLQDPLTAAAATLHSFPATAALRFDLTPTRGSASRTARVSRVGPRRERRWLLRLVRIAVRVVELVMAVEAVADVVGGVEGAVGPLRRAVGWGPGSDTLEERGEGRGEAGVRAKAVTRRRRGKQGGFGGGGSDGGSETDGAQEALLDFLTGRGDVKELLQYDRGSVRRAVEMVNTEVLEELDVPNVPATRTAISNLARSLREADATAAAREASRGASGGGDVAAAARQGAGAAGDAAAGARQEAGAAEPLPGFGPPAAVPAKRPGGGGGGGAEGQS